MSPTLDSCSLLDFESAVRYEVPDRTSGELRNSEDRVHV